MNNLSIIILILEKLPKQSSNAHKWEAGTSSQVSLFQIPYCFQNHPSLENKVG